MQYLKDKTKFMEQNGKIGHLFMALIKKTAVIEVSRKEDVINITIDGDRSE